MMLTATLLALCASTSQPDITACDTFIQQTAASHDLTQCIDLSKADELRETLVRYLRSDGQKRIIGNTKAVDAVIFALGDRCAVD